MTRRINGTMSLELNTIVCSVRLHNEQDKQVELMRVVAVYFIAIVYSLTKFDPTATTTITRMYELLASATQ